MTEVEKEDAIYCIEKYFPYDRETISAAEFGEMMTKIWAYKYFHQFDVKNRDKISIWDLYNNMQIVAELTESDPFVARDKLNKIRTGWD